MCAQRRRENNLKRIELVKQCEKRFSLLKQKDVIFRINVLSKRVDFLFVNGIIKL